MFVAFLPTTGQVLGNAYLVTLFPVCRQCGSNPTDSFTVPENGVLTKFKRRTRWPGELGQNATFRECDSAQTLYASIHIESVCET